MERGFQSLNRTRDGRRLQLVNLDDIGFERGEEEEEMKSKKDEAINGKFHFPRGSINGRVAPILLQTGGILSQSHGEIEDKCNWCPGVAGAKSLPGDRLSQGGSIRSQLSPEELGFNRVGRCSRCGRVEGSGERGGTRGCGLTRPREALRSLTALRMRSLLPTEVTPSSLRVSWSISSNISPVMSLSGERQEREREGSGGRRERRWE